MTIANKVSKFSYFNDNYKGFTCFVVDHCRKRWRNIKDTYDRKKIKKTKSLANPTKRGKKWALEQKLSFLQNTEKHQGFVTIQYNYINFVISVIMASFSLLLSDIFRI